MEREGPSSAWNLCGRPTGPVTGGARAYVVSTTSVGLICRNVLQSFEFRIYSLGKRSCALICSSDKIFKNIEFGVKHKSEFTNYIYVHVFTNFTFFGSI